MKKGIYQERGLAGKRGINAKKTVSGQVAECHPPGLRVATRQAVINQGSTMYHPCPFHLSRSWDVHHFPFPQPRLRKRRKLDWDNMSRRRFFSIGTTRIHRFNNHRNDLPRESLRWDHGVDGDYSREHLWTEIGRPLVNCLLLQTMLPAYQITPWEIGQSNRYSVQ